MTTDNKRLFAILAAVPLLLMVPLIAMQFTTEVDWDLTDFLIMGVLLSVTGLACEWALRTFKTLNQRLFFCALILGTFLLIWGELATGFFRSKITGKKYSDSAVQEIMITPGAVKTYTIS